MEENFSHPSKIHISPIMGATMDNGVVIQPVIDDEVGVLQNVTMRFKKLKYSKSFRKKLVHCIRNEKIAQRRAMRRQQEKYNNFLSINRKN